MFNLDDVHQSEVQSQPATRLRQLVSPMYCVDENEYVRQLLVLSERDRTDLDSISDNIRELVSQIRLDDQRTNLFDQLLSEYSLDTEEGVILMCLAEALLRIPDTQTADALISDKLGHAEWDSHLQHSESLLINAATWGLVLSGKFVSTKLPSDTSATNLVSRLVHRAGEAVVRSALLKSMEVMGEHFVLGQNISSAIQNGELSNYQSCSFDMLGESALGLLEAERYRQKYRLAILAVSEYNLSGSSPHQSSISIKLSALHPRYEESQRKRVMTELYQTVLELLQEARKLQVDITIDAEEMDRFELYLDLFETLYLSPCLKGWGGLGLVIQAYSKRALHTLLWLNGLSRENGGQIKIRLVKGAYWDSEIKHAQQLGIDDFPVFTRKQATDLNYIECARFLIDCNRKEGLLIPQFATHNANTITRVRHLAQENNFEFQRLHGMGDALYKQISASTPSVTVRTYAPVGKHQELLPYLVRRLLENGANTSFVHHLVDTGIPITELAEAPEIFLNKLSASAYRDESISTPPDIVETGRVNSSGRNLTIASQRVTFFEQILQAREKYLLECPISSKGVEPDGVDKAVEIARQSHRQWNDSGVLIRANCLMQMAELLEKHMPELIAMCQVEAKKIVQDCIDEVREAVDFCRYYAKQAKEIFEVHDLAGPTGETNRLFLEGKGVFVCISPWNFPVAIYVGQIAAALVAGNSVVAKPAEQTTDIAYRITQLFYLAGVPENVLQFVPGEGQKVGAQLTRNEQVAGVMFTGSLETAQKINRNLSLRDGAIAAFIAETGGQNTMIVDSTALPEQVVNDIVYSSFNSAGQRCSALRVAFIQQEIFGNIVALLRGAMAELKVGDPFLFETDIGPVIDSQAKSLVDQHIKGLSSNAKLIYQTPLSGELESECFMAPTVFQIERLSDLKKEIFGPVLHVITYRAEDLDDVLEQVGQSNYGLTLGIHSRNESFSRYIQKQTNVGNVYVNRNQVGARVGEQPFGGTGLSGTGPKAGGPNYLMRFTNERSLCINTSAIGGNVDLLSTR